MGRGCSQFVGYCLLLSAIACLFSLDAYAGNPPSLFSRPVKLDPSGRPLYNSWERQEHERQIRPRKARSPREKSDSVAEDSAAKGANVNKADTSGQANSPPSAATRSAGSSALQGSSGTVLPASTSPVPLR